MSRAVGERNGEGNGEGKLPTARRPAASPPDITRPTSQTGPLTNRPMRRCLLALALLAPLAGCFETDTLVRVRPDGSGTIEQTVRISHAALEQMRAFAEDVGEFEVMDLEKLRAQAAAFGDGVRFVTAEPISDGGGEGYRAVYAFDDVAALRLRSGTPNTEPDDEEPVTFSFEPGVPATLTVRQPDLPAPDSAEAANVRRLFKAVERGEFEGDEPKLATSVVRYEKRAVSKLLTWRLGKAERDRVFAGVDYSGGDDRRRLREAVVTPAAIGRLCDELREGYFKGRRGGPALRPPRRHDGGHRPPALGDEEPAAPPA